MKYLKFIIASTIAIAAVFGAVVFQKLRASSVQDISVKIVVGYHKPAALLDDKEVFVPIHLGRAVSRDVRVHSGNSSDEKVDERGWQWLLKNMIGDDTGDNISLQNRSYCDLTGVYWAWKNLDELGNPDYIGSMHYRRHFAFKNGELNEWFVYVDSIDDEYQKKYGLNAEQVKRTIAEYDVVVFPVVFQESIYEQYKKGHYVEVLDTALQVLREKYPEYSDTADEYMRSNRGYFLNMFVMKRELFREYCAFVFGIMEETTNHIRQNKEMVDEIFAKPVQAPGAHTIERLLSVFVEYKRKTSGIRVLELPVCFIEHPEKNLKF
ncbi:MAG: DUF4422 domain-containing protein [Holosporales bacterium]|jgi:hypothetical protein|nr:DUF4422 domain-containing protein [Holosporales bacterium]